MHSVILSAIATGLLTMAAVVGLACGDADEPSPVATATPAIAGQAPTPTATPVEATPTAVAPQAGVSSGGAAPAVQQITVRAGERGFEYYLEPGQLQVRPGTIQVHFINEGTRGHTFNVKDKGDAWTDLFNFPQIFPGQETTAEFTLLEEGSYMFYCMLYGHLDFGQFGTLRVAQ
jgi:plastocyanin